MDEWCEGVERVTGLRTYEMKADIPARFCRGSVCFITHLKFGLLKDSAATSEQHCVTVTIIVFPSLRA